MGLLRMAARTVVVAGTATAVSGRVARTQASKYEQQNEPPQDDLQEGGPPQEEPPLALAAPQDETMTKLQNLAQLHTDGVLSDAEFTAAKAKTLGI